MRRVALGQVFVTRHSVKRFRERCSEGGPWPEFTRAEVGEWIARMVVENTDYARFFYTPGRRGSSLVVPLQDEDVLLAQAICERSRAHATMIAVTTVYAADEHTYAGKTEGILPPWWMEWMVFLDRV